MWKVSILAFYPPSRKLGSRWDLFASETTMHATTLSATRLLRLTLAMALFLAPLWLAVPGARAALASGALSFSAPTYAVDEGAGTVSFTITRTGGADNAVVAQVTLTDISTSPADYRATCGALDMGFMNAPLTGANDSVLALAAQPDGKVLIGGWFTMVNGTSRNSIARLNADGSLDTTFLNAPLTGADMAVRALALQPDGKVVIGGSFTTVNGTPRNRIARLNADGSLDTSFNPGSGPNSTVLAVALQADGKVLIGGWFTTVDGTARSRIARLNADGSLDTGFSPGSGANDAVMAIAAQPDGKVLIGGWFTTVNGTSRSRIARLNADGSLDTSFDPGSGASFTVSALAAGADGKVVIGGSFTTVNGVSRNYVARLNTDGSLDTGFDPGSGPDDSVSALAVQADGKVLIGGWFTAVDGTPRNRIARLNADGTLDTGFSPGSGASASVSALAVAPDGKVLLGGYFTTVDGVTRNRIARLTGDWLLTWPAGDSSDRTLTLSIIDDLLMEADEILALTLVPLSGGATLGTYGSAQLTIYDNDTPATVTIVAGNNQSALVNTAFASQLAVIVRNASGNPLQGASVTFSAPTSGPGGTFAGAGTSVTVTTDAQGRATAPVLTANSAGGTYGVTATAAGGTNPSATFGLVNYQPPVVTSPALATLVAGDTGWFVVTAAGYPTPTLSLSGTLPGGLSFADNGDGTSTLGGDLGPGVTGTYSLTVTAENGIGTPAVQALELRVIRVAHLRVHKTDGLDTWYASWNYEYVVTLENTGPSHGAHLVVTDTLPANVYWLSLPAGAVANPDGSVSWHLSSLDRGAVVTFRLSVRTLSTARGVVTNTVAASGEGSELVTASDTTVFVAQPLTPTATGTPTPTATATATATPTATATATGAPVATATATPTPTATPDGLPAPTATPTATATPPSGDLVLSGTVYDLDPGAAAVPSALGGRPLAGARVAAILCLPGTYEDLTGPDGRYELTIPGAVAGLCSELDLEVSAPGYATLRQTWPIDDLRARPQRDLALSPVSLRRLWLPAVLR